MESVTARHAHPGQRHADRKGMFTDRIRDELWKEIPALVITSPIVVPVWWGIWKLCDILYGMK